MKIKIQLQVSMKSINEFLKNKKKITLEINKLEKIAIKSLRN